MGRPPRDDEFMQVTAHFSGVVEARVRMGCPWMSRDELAQAIPPAYAEFIERQIMASLGAGDPLLRSSGQCAWHSA